MKITLESTSEIIKLDGIEHRVWQGTTAGGAPVTAFITRVTPGPDADASEFYRELRETRAPTPIYSWPLRMVL